MNPDIITTLTSGIADFPALPAVVTRVMQVTGDPDSSVHDLMQTISSDPSLAVKVLKIANSAFYGRIRRTASLEQALMVLGFEEVRNIVLATAVFNTFNKLKKTNQFDIGKFWKHSFICGLAAKMIAEEQKLPANEMFTIGLIHDIGKLVICMVLPRQFSEIVKMTGPFELKTLEAEKHILHVAHDEIGGRLLKRWLFPEKMVVAVRFHHRLGKADGHMLLPVLIHLADGLAHMEGTSAAQDDFSSAIVATARSHEIDWGPATVQKYQNGLDSQKEAQAGVMEILLS